LVPSNLLLSHRLRRDPQLRDPCWRQTRDTGSIHPSRLGASLGASRRGRLRRGRAERHPAGAAAVRTARPRPGAVRGATTPRHPGIGTVGPGIDQPPSRGRTCSYGHLPTGRCPMGRQVACAAATVPPTRHHSDLRSARAVRWSDHVDCIRLRFGLGAGPRCRPGLVACELRVLSPALFDVPRTRRVQRAALLTRPPTERPVNDPLLRWLKWVMIKRLARAVLSGLPGDVSRRSGYWLALIASRMISTTSSPIGSSGAVTHSSSSSTIS